MAKERLEGKSIRPQDLLGIAKKDLTGWYRAFDLRVQDLIDLALNQNPDWADRQELEELMALKIPKSEARQNRLAELILGLTGLNREQLEYEVLQTYANQNGYQLVVN